MNWLQSVFSYFTGEPAKEHTGVERKPPRKNSQHPVLVSNPANAAPRVDQGLEWAKRSLRKDADGDEAHEFIQAD